MTLKEAGELFGIIAGGLTAIKFAISGVRFFSTMASAVHELTTSVQKLEANLEKFVHSVSTDVRDHEARLRVLEDRTDG